MKPYKLRELSREELEQRRGELTEELFNLRFASSTRALDNPLRLRTLRKEVARINTIIREDQSGIRPLGAGGTRSEEA